jgi:AcrR family transcriptional regulator
MAKIITADNHTKRDVIIREAAALFRKSGFRAASMRELADKLGVEAASLYNHIDSKNDLLQAICIRTGQEFIRMQHRIIAGGGPAHEILEQITRAHIRLMLSGYDEVYVANHEWKHLPEPALGQFLSLRRQYEKQLAEVIESGIKTKDLLPVQPQIAVLTILSALRGIEFWHRNKKNISPQQLEDEMVKLLLQGIKK